MPKYNSSYSELMKKASSVLSNIRRDIRTREREIATLRQEEHRLSSMVGRARTKGARARATTRRGRRVNWQGVLAKMPKQFKASDLRKVPEVRTKKSSELFAGITRWIESGAVTRKERGVYQRAK